MSDPKPHFRHMIICKECGEKMTPHDFEHHICPVAKMTPKPDLVKLAKVCPEIKIIWGEEKWYHEDWEIIPVTGGQIRAIATTILALAEENERLNDFIENTVVMIQSEAIDYELARKLYKKLKGKEPSCQS